ncbi:MAG TPA: glutathione S-transferase family protein, partial [Archangium sp.]|nr:glutathione S-transferase family protein [Archangium sp.]
ALAAASKPLPTDGEAFVDLHGLSCGARVTVAATDYGIDPVEGELVLSRPNELAVRRVDARAGEVVVHFPRLGFQVQKVE